MVKNITLSAEEELIQKARARAMAERKSLNVVFREWLGQYTHQAGSGKNYQQLMRQLRHIRAGKRFSRDELNER